MSYYNLREHCRLNNTIYYLARVQLWKIWNANIECNIANFESRKFWYPTWRKSSCGRTEGCWRIVIRFFCWLSKFPQLWRLGKFGNDSTQVQWARSRKSPRNRECSQLYQEFHKTFGNLVTTNTNNIDSHAYTMKEKNKVIQIQFSDYMKKEFVSANDEY